MKLTSYTRRLAMVLGLIGATSLLSTAQIEIKELPVSARLNLAKQEQILDLTPSIDWAKIVDEDNANHEKGDPLRVGLSIPVNLNINETGEWIHLPDGRMMWRLSIKSEGANALGLVFDEFNLPKEAKLFIYNPRQDDVLGALGNHNNTPEGVLSTRVIQGNTLTIEYVEPYSSKGGKGANYLSEGKLHIGELIYMYADALQSASAEKARPGASAECHVDINCSPVGDDWQTIKRGVAHILYVNGSSWYVCSGSLVNNAKEDATPYFLTANHCGADASSTDKLKWQFYFNFERVSCGEGFAPTNQTMIGCKMVSTGPIDGGSDFLLLKFNDFVPQAYSPYFNGWSTASAPPQEGVCIHHPKGDVKKISTTNTIISFNNVVVISDNEMPRNSTWRINWSSNSNGWGVTEGGSSGSPLFNQEGQIIGTLSGGSSSCDSQTANDYFGQFRYHWDKNSTSPKYSLKSLLDPDNKGITSLQGYDPFKAPDAVKFLAENFEDFSWETSEWVLEETNTTSTWEVTEGYHISDLSSVEPVEGEKFLLIEAHEDAQEEWLISPIVDLTNRAELELSFYFSGDYNISITEDACDLTLKARIDEEPWVTLWTEHDAEWDSEDHSFTWHKVSIKNLTDYEQKKAVQFAFVYSGQDGAYFSIDHILLAGKYEADPTAPSPVRLTANAINDHDVELSWLASTLSGKHEIQYAKAEDLTNLNWPSRKRGTLFNLTDFGLSYPAEVSELSHYFIEHASYPWPNNKYKMHIIDYDGINILYSSNTLTAISRETMTHEIANPVTVNRDFFVMVEVLDESGFPSSASQKVPLGTANSYYYADENSQIYGMDSSRDGESFEFIMGATVTTTSKKKTKKSSVYPAKNDLSFDNTKMAVVPQGYLPIAASKGNPEPIGYKIYRDLEHIATINDPETTTYTEKGLDRGIYTYHVTALYNDPERESTPSNTAYVALTSIDNAVLNELAVYPNPFNENITLDNAHKVSRVIIRNIVGQTLLDIQHTGSAQLNINTAGMPSGIYAITVYSREGNQKTMKVIKR